MIVHDEQLRNKQKSRHIKRENGSVGVEPLICCAQTGWRLIQRYAEICKRANLALLMLYAPMWYADIVWITFELYPDRFQTVAHQRIEITYDI